MRLWYEILTVERITLGQVVVISLSQDPSLHPSNQTLQITMIHVEIEFCHDSK